MAENKKQKEKSVNRLNNSVKSSAEELKKMEGDANKQVEQKSSTQDADEEDEGGVCAFFKARKGRPGGNMRKRAGKPLTSSTKDNKKPRPEEDVPGTWESNRSAVPFQISSHL
jgi:phage-related protein